MKKAPTTKRRGHEEARRESKLLKKQPTAQTEKIKPAPDGFWNGFYSTRQMAPTHAYVKPPLSAFDGWNLFKGDGPHPIVRLIPEPEFRETLGMSIDAAKSAGLIERVAEIAGKRFYRPAPEVRP